MYIVKVMKHKYSNLRINECQKRNVRENRKFNPNWEERYFFTYNNGKPQCLVRLQVISVLKEFLFTRKHTGNTMEIPGTQFWNNWRVTMPATRGENGQLPLLKGLFTGDVLSMFIICESAFSIMKRLKGDTWNRMADETCMPASVCWLWK